jgi:hypothetical protein
MTSLISPHKQQQIPESGLGGQIPVLADVEGQLELKEVRTPPHVDIRQRVRVITHRLMFQVTDHLVSRFRRDQVVD